MVNSKVTKNAGWVLIILALVSAFQLAYFSWDNRQRSNCQVKYNSAMAEALQRRSQYADQDRESLVEFVRKVSQANTREKSRDALRNYLTTQERIDRERQANPLPHLPEGRC